MAIGDGELIVIEFTQDIINDVSGTHEHFEIEFQEYDFVPGGSLVNKTRVPSAVSNYSTNSILLEFPSGNINGFQNAVGQITVNYDGAGGITGYGGPVPPFSEVFFPIDLIMKPNIAEREDFVLGALCDNLLIDVAWQYKEPTDHMNLMIVVTGQLTPIGDI